MQDAGDGVDSLGSQQEQSPSVKARIALPRAQVFDGEDTSGRKARLSARSGPDIRSILNYLAFLVIAVTVSYAGLYLVFPRCSMVPECSRQAEPIHNVGERRLFILGATLMVWFREAVGLAQIWYMEGAAPLTVFGMPGSLGIRFIFLLVLSILVVLEALETAGLDRYLALAAPPVQETGVDWLPIDTLRYAEWLLNVPLIQIIFTSCLMDIPFKETYLLNTVTMVYIFFAILGLATPWTGFRWLMITFAFVGYFVASRLQAKMTMSFIKTCSSGRPGFKVRMGFTWFWIALNGIYGGTYLCRIFTGFYDGHVFMWFDIIAKMLISFGLAEVWGQEQHKATIALVLSHASLNSSYLSLLRSSYDFVLPCRIEGGSKIRLAFNPDAAALSQLISRDVQGEQFHSLLNNPQEVARFEEYVMQVFASQSCLAQACHFDLQCDTGRPLTATAFLSTPAYIGSHIPEQWVLALRTEAIEQENEAAGEGPGHVKTIGTRRFSSVSEEGENDSAEGDEVEKNISTFESPSFFLGREVLDFHSRQKADDWIQNQAALISSEMLNLCAFCNDAEAARPWRVDAMSSLPSLPPEGAHEVLSSASGTSSAISEKRRLLHRRQYKEGATEMQRQLSAQTSASGKSSVLTERRLQYRRQYQVDAMSDLPSLNGSVSQSDACSAVTQSTNATTKTRKSKPS